MNSETATAAAAIRNQMSEEEFKEYQMMAALYNKTSKWNGSWLGVIDAIPFLTEVIDWSDSMVCEMEEKQTVKNATLSSIMENVRCQNPVAYGSGYAASLAAQTAAIKGLFESGEGAEIAKSAEGLERAETAETVKGLEVESGTGSVDIELKYKDGWTAAQKAEADAKVKALSDATTEKTPANRGGTSASSRYKSAYGKSSVPSGYDVDHTIDLQLGGADDILNMNPLDMSVNRCLGVQIKNAIKDYPDGTVFGQFTIK